MKYKNMPEDERRWIIEMRAGDHRAFSKLYERYQVLLSGFLFRMRIDEDMIKEVVQTTFHKLWESRENLLDDRPLQAYLFQIAKHSIYNEVRKNALRETYVASLSPSNFETEHDRHHELREVLASIVEGLSPKRKEVFKLSRFEGYSNQEIAAQMGLSKSTVENHINAALKEIRVHLEKNGFLCITISLLNFFN